MPYGLPFPLPLPSSISQLSSILHYMNSLGVRDTVTKTQDQQQSVNGLPLSVHVNKMVEIINIVCQVTQ